MKPIEDLNETEFAALVEQAVASPDAPDHVVKAAIALWPVPKAKPSPVLQAAAALLASIRAALKFDSWALAPLATGMRSTGGESRHLLFSAEGRDIDVRITPSASEFALTGQILGPDETGTIELRPDGSDPASAAQVVCLDDLGEFRLDGVPRGDYVLTFRFADAAVELPAIRIGDRAG